MWPSSPLGAIGCYGNPLPFWIGLSFSTISVWDLSYSLSFPGLLPNGQGLIAQFPNTSLWLSVIGQSILFIFLLVAAMARWPQSGMPGERWTFWLVLGVLMAMIAIASLSVVFELHLPILVVDRAFTSLYRGWANALTVGFGLGAVLSAYRYRQTGDLLLGYLSLAEVLFALAYSVVLLSAARYEPLWYLAFIFSNSGFVAMLFGLLSEYVDLYGRERDKTVELERLRDDAQRRAAELQTILDNLVDSVFVCDTHGHLILVNEAGLRLLGATSAEKVEYDLTELFARARLRHMDGTPVEPDQMALLRALRGEIILQEAEILYSPQTKRHIFVRSSAVPIRDEEGTTIGAVAVTRDTYSARRPEWYRVIIRQTG
ncbi:MAG: PAS domain-containing protein [Chloroflexota bacterium]|nr:MAG: PAS domain-containing protein [Chloroflexota bacterium]